MPTFDVEYIFLQLRGRSIGEEIDIQYQLPDHVCEKDGDCDYVTKINVDEIEIVKNKKHKALIDITDDIKVNMRSTNFATAMERATRTKPFKAGLANTIL